MVTRPDPIQAKWGLLESVAGGVFSIIGHLPLLILYIPVWLLWGLLGAMTSRPFQGQVLRYTKDRLGNRLKNLYDALEEWMNWTHDQMDRWLGPAGVEEERDERDAGEMLVDRVFREDEFDREQAEALELAYSASIESACRRIG